MRVRRPSVLIFAFAAAISSLPVLTPVASAQPAAVALPAAAAKLSDVSLFTNYRSAVTTAKRKLSFNVQAGVSPYGHSFAIQIETPGDGESHEWDFTPPVHDIDLALPGKLVLPASALGPFGRVHLSIVKAGKTTTSTCDADDYSTQTLVKVTGTVLFSTGSGTKHGWGAIEKTGKHTISFSGRDTILERDYGSGGDYCGIENIPTDCTNQSDSFVTAYGQLADIDSYYERSHGRVDISRTIDLAKPKLATRDDFAAVPIEMPTLKSFGAGGEQMTVTATPSSRASGSYTVSSSQPGVASLEPCYKSAKGNSTATSTNWGVATFANGTKPLVIRDQIFGSLHVAKASTTEPPRFSTVTYPAVV